MLYFKHLYIFFELAACFLNVSQKEISAFLIENSYGFFKIGEFFRQGIKLNDDKFKF